MFSTQVAYKKDAKANLHYTSVVDRPDIKKATQAAKLISEVISACMKHKKSFVYCCFLLHSHTSLIVTILYKTIRDGDEFNASINLCITHT